MKNDFRLQYPLWMMGFIVVLGLLAFGLSSPVTEVINERSIVISLGPVGTIFAVGSIVIYIIMLTIFLLKLKKHNKKNPAQRISPFSIRPPEYLEQDEGMTYITRKAAQKVYTFITWSLPALAGFAIALSMPRLYIIFGILLVALGQYWIYFSEIRKHLKEETE
ncbi:uncharacterized membrane protein (DUF485 family) [Planomicrobium koreense]|uniref:Uncharacterized membrane protein (DUF485 family) n=1 Tax=Planococcus koreensis TaxID=112331 RepID=A0A7W8FUJ5_9BACL|nr:hypothetical protein [Planococcus koreensis]MBB5180670.1 uncharacterized membrane protein (DUF485 family) [Planococcus koreensis]